MSVTRFLSIDGATATGAGDSYVADSSTHSLQVTFSNVGGSVTAMSVNIQGSVDGTNYDDLTVHSLSAAELSAGTVIVSYDNALLHRVRANVSLLTATGTTTISATVMSND